MHLTLAYGEYIYLQGPDDPLFKCFEKWFQQQAKIYTSYVLVQSIHLHQDAIHREFVMGVLGPPTMEGFWRKSFTF